MNGRPWLAMLRWILLLALSLAPAVHAREPVAPVVEWVALGELPPQAGETLTRIRHGGPFPHAKDGTIFFNREGLLPQRRRGYYTEYTVPSPGARDRGARRIVAGGDARVSDEYYYTGDHYRSFRRIRVNRP